MSAELRIARVPGYSGVCAVVDIDGALVRRGAVVWRISSVDLRNVQSYLVAGQRENAAACKPIRLGKVGDDFPRNRAPGWLLDVWGDLLAIADCGDAAAEAAVRVSAAIGSAGVRVAGEMVYYVSRDDTRCSVWRCCGLSGGDYGEPRDGDTVISSVPWQAVWAGGDGDMGLPISRIVGHGCQSAPLQQWGGGAGSLRGVALVGIPGTSRSEVLAVYERGAVSPSLAVYCAVDGSLCERWDSDCQLRRDTCANLNRAVWALMRGESPENTRFFACDDIVAGVHALLRDGLTPVSMCACGAMFFESPNVCVCESCQGRSGVRLDGRQEAEREWYASDDDEGVTLGVEIECVVGHGSSVHGACAGATFLDSRSMGWTPDGSIGVVRARNGQRFPSRVAVEFVSGKLPGLRSLDNTLKRWWGAVGAWRERGGDVWVNSSCGHHLHVGLPARLDSWKAVRRWWLCYLLRWEDEAYRLVDATRAVNRYCHRMRRDAESMSAERVAACCSRERCYMGWYYGLWWPSEPAGNAASLISFRNHNGVHSTKYHSTRYRALNLHSYFYRGSVELRHHQGVIDRHKISRWARLWVAVARYCYDTRDDVSLDLPPGLIELSGDDSSVWLNRVAAMHGDEAASAMRADVPVGVTDDVPFGV